MLPFEIRIRDRSGQIVATGKVLEVLEGAYLGELIRADMPEDLAELLREYHLACESGALGYCGRVHQQVVGLELRVTGIPGNEASMRVLDFQLGPDGLFALQVD